MGYGVPPIALNRRRAGGPAFLSFSGLWATVFALLWPTGFTPRSADGGAYHQSNSTREDNNMGVIFDTLAKSDNSVHNCTEQAASEALTKAYRKAAYPTGHDTTTEVTSAEGAMAGDASQQDKDDAHLGEIMVDATLFDEKVRSLVEGAGAAYNYKAAAQSGLAKRVDPELLGAVQRLQKNAPLLNEVVRRTNLRRARQGYCSDPERGWGA